MPELQKVGEPERAEDYVLAFFVGAAVGFIIAWLDHFFGKKIGLAPA